MSETTWTDPRYADVVETFDRLRQQRQKQGPLKPCRSCTHGLGKILMVDPQTQKPIVVDCPSC